MTNGDKMRDLVGADSQDDEIVSWAYMNRITLTELAFEPEFKDMETSINAYLSDKGIADDAEQEFKDFLKADYVEGATQ